MNSGAWRHAAGRWMKFNLVGAMGIGVQLGVLALLTVAFRLHYLLATGVAVECAVLHNFVWHEHFTWADRSRGCSRGLPGRLVTFVLSTGFTSVGGNLLLMRYLTGQAHWNPLLANGVSIVACSLLNFLVGDRWVFRMEKPNGNSCESLVEERREFLLPQERDIASRSRVGSGGAMSRLGKLLQAILKLPGQRTIQADQVGHQMAEVQTEEVLVNHLVNSVL